MARFGEMMRLGGRFNDQQIVPREVVDDIRRGGSPAHFVKAGYTLLPGWSYRSMWWVSHNEHGAFTARGIHGQAIYVDPAAEMVIARFASHPLAANVNLDPLSLPAYRCDGDVSHARLTRAYFFRFLISPSMKSRSAGLFSPSCVASSSARSTSQPSTITRFMSHIPAALPPPAQ